MIALLVNPDNLGTGEQYIRFMQEAARVKGVQLPVLKARNEGEIDTAFASLGQLQAGGIVLSPDRFLFSRSNLRVGFGCRGDLLCPRTARRDQVFSAVYPKGDFGALYLGVCSPPPVTLAVPWCDGPFRFSHLDFSQRKNLPAKRVTLLTVSWFLEG